MSLKSLAPRMRQIPARKSAILSVLDVGASKIVCLIARLTPMEPSDALRGRTHRCKVLGIGHQRSRGVKGGAVVDLHAAEHAVRLAVDAAERMAGVEVDGVIVNMSGGRLASRRHGADAKLRGKTVAEHDIHHVLEAAAAVNAEPGRTILHALPTAFRLDSTKDVRDPKGMVGDELGADLHLASCDSAAARNLMLAIERCHLRVEAMVATPYAAGLSTLVDDEAELGAAVVDFGGGSTTVGVFSGGRLVHVDAVALGGNHVTMDVARGLNVAVSDAERLKTLYGACIASPSDDRETISVHRLGDDHGSSEPSAEVGTGAHHPPARRGDSRTGARPAEGGGFRRPGRPPTGADRRREPADRPAGTRPRDRFGQARIGRPLGVEGLPESAKSPAFAAAVGLMVYPQVAGLEYFGATRAHAHHHGDDGLCRAGRTVAEGEFLRRVRGARRRQARASEGKHASNRRRRASNAMRPTCRSI